MFVPSVVTALMQTNPMFCPLKSPFWSINPDPVIFVTLQAKESFVGLTGVKFVPIYKSVLSTS
jgi:hypothetical protein